MARPRGIPDEQLVAAAQELQMRELPVAGWREMEGHLTRLAREAIAAGELSGRPPAEQVARILRGRGGWCEPRAAGESSDFP